ncbi:MAG: hypothetical protein ABWZ77_01315 [Naasia sp.]
MGGVAGALFAGALALLTASAPALPTAAATSADPLAASGWDSGLPAVAARLADPADFDPALLISDETFFSPDRMDADEIQAFLEQTECLPQEGVDCLADFRETTPDVPAVGSGHCSAYRGDEWESAAVIIAGVAEVCGVNPQVLLVLLQKEQSLLTRPTPSGYERAMGYACPDTADCDTEYFGFFNQVYNAAWQFRQYTLFPSDRGFGVGTYDVRYSPDPACGAAPVDIRNQATANLYLYTPYQPNTAAVDNLYGDGDACSAYGNRNFWRIFTDWFGDPTLTRYPDWMGGCLTREAGLPCLDTFWLPELER